MTHKAVFVDRDNTLIDDPGYLSDPKQVKLLPGVELAIKTLHQAGYKVVVVTNQSGVARGMFNEDTLEAIHTELRRRLADKGARLDAIYYCPFHPEGTVAKYKRESDLRKPAPGMLLKAAKELDLDLAESWMVGDSERDVQAGLQAGCRAVLIRKGEGGVTQAWATTRNLVEAARVIMHASPASRSHKAAEDEVEIAEPETDLAIEVPLLDEVEETPAAEPAEPAPVEEPVAAEPPELPKSPEPLKPAFTLSQPAPAAGGDGDGDSPLGADEDSHVRQEILRHVRHMALQADEEPFSVLNLLGGLCQVVVVLFVVVAFHTMLAKSKTDEATFYALIAIVFQTMSLTLFTMARKSK